MTIRINNKAVPVKQVHRHGVNYVDLNVAVEMLGYEIGSREVRDGDEFDISVTGAEEHPCDLVTVGPEDKVVLAQRGNRKTLTPIVLNRKRPMTKDVFAAFRYKETETGPIMWVLTSYYGKKTYKEIAQYDNPDEFREAYEFWSQHAIVCSEGDVFTISTEYKSFGEYVKSLKLF